MPTTRARCLKDYGLWISFLSPPDSLEPLSDTPCLREALRRRQGTLAAGFFIILTDDAYTNRDYNRGQDIPLIIR